MGGEPMPTPEILASASLVVGLVVGSFLNVVIHRLPRGESIVFPGSRCPGCGRAIPPLENVPIVSYLWLRGACRGCGARISPRYPIVEAMTGLVFAAIALRYGATLMTPMWMTFAGGLIAAGMIDLDHGIVPDEISVGGLALGLVGVPALHALAGTPVSEAIVRSVSGALVGGGVLWMIGFVHARLSVGLGRRFEHWPGDGEAPPRITSLDYWIWFPGMGFGDIKLLAAIGAFVGPLGVLETILASSLLGLALGAGWVLVTRRWGAPFGFAPAIAVGAILVVLSPYRLLPLFCP